MAEDGLFTISELARRSGLTAATIKHYVNEGLLAPVKKTGKTMAWYNEESVRRLQLIRSLKQERFLPLSVIKRLIGEGALTDAAVELDHSIYPSPEVDLEERAFTAAELARESGLSEERIGALTEAGVIHSVAGRFSELDAKIAQIVRQREEDGLSFSYSRELLGQYTAAMDRAVYRDIQLFLSMVLADPEVTDPLKLFNRDDDSINLFLFYTRRKFNRSYTNVVLGQVARFTERLRPWLPMDEIDVLKLAERIDATSRERRALQSLAEVLAKGRPASTGSEDDEASPSSLVELAELVRDMADFAGGGAFGRQMQQLLVRFQHIERYGSVTRLPRKNTEPDLRRRLLDRWITGAIYMALPEILGYRRTGARMLSTLVAEIQERRRLLAHTGIPKTVLEKLRAQIRSVEDKDDR